MRQDVNIYSKRLTDRPGTENIGSIMVALCACMPTSMESCTGMQELSNNFFHGMHYEVALMRWDARCWLLYVPSRPQEDRLKLTGKWLWQELGLTHGWDQAYENSGLKSRDNSLRRLHHNARNEDLN